MRKSWHIGRELLKENNADISAIQMVIQYESPTVAQCDKRIAKRNTTVADNGEWHWYFSGQIMKPDQPIIHWTWRNWNNGKKEHGVCLMIIKKRKRKNHPIHEWITKKKWNHPWIQGMVLHLIPRMSKKMKKKRSISKEIVYRRWDKCDIKDFQSINHTGKFNDQMIEYGG
jgi:hypothetical protein